MKLKNVLPILITMLLYNYSVSQENPDTSSQIIDKALEQAKKEHKNVFIMFHASWCKWCKKMDATINDASVKDFFTSNYVIEHLVVLESNNKKQLENPGAHGMLKKYGGGESGIPYWLIFDSRGNLLADSKMVKNEFVLKGRGSNIGCPGTEDEIKSFIYKLKETSRLNDEELALIAEKFTPKSLKPTNP